MKKPCHCKCHDDDDDVMGSYQLGSFGGSAGIQYPNFRGFGQPAPAGGGMVGGGGFPTGPRLGSWSGGGTGGGFGGAVVGGGGAGGGTTAGGGGGSATPPQMPYQPQGPRVQNLINPLAEAGKGLLDPNSAYSQRMRTELGEDIGKQSEVQQRAAALRAARGGLGAGASPELLETQGEIGQQGLEAYGDASARALLGGMQLGGQMLSPAISGQLGLQGQQLQAYLAQQAGQQEQEQMRWQQAMDQQRLQQEMLLRQMSMASGF